MHQFVKQESEQMSQYIPSIFISHGAPTIALENRGAVEVWSQLGKILPRPKNILVVSAHWTTPYPELMGAEKPETVHDFYGFPKPLYQIKYPAPGCPELAHKLRTLFVGMGGKAHINPYQGFDHGAWIPLMFMFPKADIPVTQISIQPNETPEYHYKLGEALKIMSELGTLVLASGSITHNLSEWRPGTPEEEQKPLNYVKEFQEWMHQKIMSGNIQEVLNYEKLAPWAQRAHPTNEHLLPLFVAMGAGLGKPMRHYDQINEEILAMDVYTF